MKKAFIVITISAVASILITSLFSLSLLAAAGKIEVYERWETITRNDVVVDGIAAYAKAGNRFISLSCRDMGYHPDHKEYGIFILANDPIHNPGTEVTTIFSISENRYELTGVVGKGGNTLRVKLPLGQNDVVDAMKRGNRLEVYIPVVSGVYPVKQTFSLNGFTKASQGVIEKCGE